MADKSFIEFDLNNSPTIENYAVGFSFDSGKEEQYRFEDLPFVNTGDSGNLVQWGETPSGHLDELALHKTDSGNFLALEDSGKCGGVKQGVDGTYDIRPVNEGATAGNARGENSVDLQTLRTSAYNIAAAPRSVILGGAYNQVGSAADFGMVFGGSDCRVTADFGCAYGENALASRYGQSATAAGKFSSRGDAQGSLLYARKQTTNATQTELFLDGSGQRCSLVDDSTTAFRITIVARRTDSGSEGGAYEFSGAIARNSGTTALIGSVTKNVLAEDDASWDASVEADDSVDALVIKVTGAVGKTIRWVAKIELTETAG